MAGDTVNNWFKYYRYDPSMAAAVIFIVLFFATTMLHLYQLVRTKTWIVIPLLVGGIFETNGYIGRAVSSRQTPDWTLGPYIVQAVLLLVAPALFAATIYMELGRIIILVDGEHHSIIKKRWLTKIFVCGDILSFLMQSGGAGIMAGKTMTAVRNGQHLVVGGLFLQIIFFGFFVVVAAVFNLRINKVPTARSASSSVPWRRHIHALYYASGLIMLRSILRVVEYVQGNAGYIMSHEVFLYIFDSVLMLGVMVLLNVVHPSEIYALLRGGKVSRGGLKLYYIGSQSSPYTEDAMAEGLTKSGQALGRALA